jgi:hypothetical protein
MGEDPTENEKGTREGPNPEILKVKQESHGNGTPATEIAKPKSAFAPMRAKLDPAVASKLPQAVPKQQPPSASAKKTVPPSSSVRPPDLVTVEIRCELWLEIVDRPEKLNCAWSYVARENPAGVQRVGIVLNAGQWPAGGALERDDKRAVRWLASLAVLDRLNTWSNEPVLRAARDYLVHAVLGNGAGLWECGLWAAYQLKDSDITAPIETLPIFGTSPNGGPHLVTSFLVTVHLPAGRSPEVLVRRGVKGGKRT